MERRKGKNGGKGIGIKKHNWWVQNRQKDVRNSIGYGEAKELICTTHEHELREWGLLEGRGFQAEGGKGRNIETTVIA